MSKTSNTQAVIDTNIQANTDKKSVLQASNDGKVGGLNELLQKLLELRIQHRAGQLQQTHLIKNCKRDIARYKHLRSAS